MASQRTMLHLVKTLHTIAWAFFAGSTFYVLYAGITGTINRWVWIAIGAVLFEALILFVNKWTCPITPLAARYTEDRSDNFDIYLPEWLAKHNKTIFTILFVIGLALVLIESFYRNR
jgi:hypothetical protein